MQRRQKGQPNYPQQAPQKGGGGGEFFHVRLRLTILVSSLSVSGIKTLIKINLLKNLSLAKATGQAGTFLVHPSLPLKRQSLALAGISRYRWLEYVRIPMAPQIKKKTTAPVPKAKSSKKGCLFWLIFLVLILGGAGYYFQAPLNEQLSPYGGLAGIQRMVTEKFSALIGSSEEDEDALRVAAMSPLPKIEPAKPKPKPKPAITAQQGEQLYYVRVGGCMTEDCRLQIIKELEALHLDYLVKDYKRKTVYWELASAQLFTKSQAENKLVDLDRHARDTPPGHMRPVRGKWRISLGNIPDKRRAVQMRSYLAQLYPDVDMKMVLLPKRHSFDMEYVYAGPYSSQFNAQSIADILQGRRFIQEVFLTADP
ncbi:MAG: hypothetical protein A2527_07350 [Candidatus Lambdaproteobacteria bacterium RIFOXYD2_FULL_50_16]|uniref:SPOR domain-containing protein n=1 Tax=Candidatus Lambdaproteobacteria bacterium RIFOXYD2_FULL_50_16 TaxID=1817772 RepID=A0A1F6GB68_9PROT|nr:MAG: hypothetical protein A2527_07350 [Candidatus Lambdaproteobacteria bacterium RIFOXYD2_FULL_50_16]